MPHVPVPSRILYELFGVFPQIKQDKNVSVQGQSDRKYLEIKLEVMNMGLPIRFIMMRWIC